MKRWTPISVFARKLPTTGMCYLTPESVPVTLSQLITDEEKCVRPRMRATPTKVLTKKPDTDATITAEVLFECGNPPWMKGTLKSRK
jgi:hypothetical protein